VAEKSQGFMFNNSTNRAQKGTPQINHHHIFIKLLRFPAPLSVTIYYSRCLTILFTKIFIVL